MVAAGFAVIALVALVTGSVLLVGYVAAAASLLTIVALLVKKAIRGRSVPLIRSAVPRWVGSEEREAA